MAQTTAAPTLHAFGGTPYLTAPERADRGKAARAKVPRESHAEYSPSPRRLDPLDIIERQSATRVA